jgi:iron(III) transport system ATP-binding protein
VWLEVEAVTRRFGARLALDRLSLALAQGEIGCLLGPSGSGKTTALRCIAGFETPDEGRIVCGGRPLAAAGVHVPAHQRGVGVVFQDHALFPHLTVRGNVEFGLHALPRRDRKVRATQMLERVGLGDRGDAWPAELSGGQQQRVALARALAPRPAVLLLDEPFASLDPALREKLVPEIRGLLKAEGITALAVSHDQHDAFGLADRIALLRDGRIEQFGTPYELYHTPCSRFAASFVGHACFLPAWRAAAGGWSSELGDFPDARTSALTGPDDAHRATVQGERFDIMLRPEDLLLDPHAAAKARVVERQFRGADFLYTLELSSGRHVLSLASSHVDHEVGATVGLRVALDHVVAFPAGGA